MNTLRKIKAFLLFPVLPIIVVFFYPVNLFIVHPICLKSTVEHYLSAKNLSGEMKVLWWFNLKTIHTPIFIQKMCLVPS